MAVLDTSTMADLGKVNIRLNGVMVAAISSDGSILYIRGTT